MQHIHNAEIIVGGMIVWVVGALVSLAALAVFIWLATWCFWQLLRDAMINAGTWHIWVQQKRTMTAWKYWAAERCRLDDEAGYGGGLLNLPELRKFFAQYDPDNELNWKQP